MHRPEDTEFGALLTTLREVVTDAKGTLTVMDKRGMVMTRIWCLYEAWHSLQKGNDNGLRVLMYGVDIVSIKFVSKSTSSKLR